MSGLVRSEQQTLALRIPLRQWLKPHCTGWRLVQGLLLVAVVESVPNKPYGFCGRLSPCLYFVVVFNCIAFTWCSTELFRRAQRCGLSALSSTQPGQNAEIENSQRFRGLDVLVTEVDMQCSCQTHRLFACFHHSQCGIMFHLLHHKNCCQKSALWV